MSDSNVVQLPVPEREDPRTMEGRVWRRARRAADEQANEMRRKLEGGLTPAAMGWPQLTAEELIKCEWHSWFDAEKRP